MEQNQNTKESGFFEKVEKNEEDKKTPDLKVRRQVLSVNSVHT